MPTPKTAQPQDSVSETEVSIILNKSLRSLFNLRKCGQMPTHFVHGKKQIRYSRADIEALKVGGVQ